MTKKRRPVLPEKAREPRTPSGSGRDSGRAAQAVARRGARYWSMVGLFTLSGACGLVYQVVWGRLAVLVFGSTTPAIATVLGVFFLGLAIGSYLAGRFADRFGHPLVLYGWLEIGIGIYAALFQLPLEAMQQLHQMIFPLLYDSPALLTVARVLMA